MQFLLQLLQVLCQVSLFQKQPKRICLSKRRMEFISIDLTKSVYSAKGMIQAKSSVNDLGIVVDTAESLRIRKLTPKECWRLIGFSEDFESK